MSLKHLVMPESKDTITDYHRQISKWEKVLMTHNQQNSYTRIFKELLQNNIKKTDNPIWEKKSKRIGCLPENI